MNHKISITKNTIAAAVAVSFFSLLITNYQLPITSIAAQTVPPTALLTWQADNLYPADYQGKALPSPGSPVTVAAALVESGHFVDSISVNFEWYVDERFTSDGKGANVLAFTAGNPSGGAHFIRVEGTTDKGVVFSGSARIPVAAPRLTIDAPFPRGAPWDDEGFLVSAIPLFWNVTSLANLEFTWLVNGRREEGSRESRITLRVPRDTAGRAVSVEVYAQNRSNPSEYAKAAGAVMISP